MFKLQENSNQENNPEIKIYNIVKCDYHIIIQLTFQSIKILFDNQSIFITVPRVWDGHKRYIINNETTGKITVLHQVVFTNQLAMYNHFVEAFQHIINNFSANQLLYILKTVLSLRNYQKLAHKFRYIWENPLFETNYKLLKYKIKQHRTLAKFKKYESICVFQQAQIQKLEDECKQLTDNKRCVSIEISPVKFV
jgi:hypothetical protein